MSTKCSARYSGIVSGTVSATKELGPTRRQALLRTGELALLTCLGSACGSKPVTTAASCMANPEGMVVPGAENLAVDTAMAVTVDGAPYFIARDAGGFMALSAICTHMGCTVGFTAGQATFDCPCHGSEYKIDGTVMFGPAPRALERVLLCRNSSNQLVIDTTQDVTTSDRLT